jgi:2-dehydropantoate 2-reductase
MQAQAEPSPSRPLQIAVIGVGGIGSAFAFQLARTGNHNLTVIARPGSLRLQQLQQNNGIVHVNGARAQVHIADALDEQTPYDLIIVTLLAHQVDAVLPALRRSAASHILFMFNNFNPERLQEALGAERCTFGMPFIQAFLTHDGRLNATIANRGPKSKISRQTWVDLFVASGVPAALEPDMLLWLRCHVPLCIAFQSVSLFAMHRGGGASWREAIICARGMQASFALIQALGYSIYPPAKALFQISPASAIAALLWCLSRIRSFRELLATGAGECRALIDELIAVASRTHPPLAISRIAAMRPIEKAS